MSHRNLIYLFAPLLILGFSVSVHAGVMFSESFNLYSPGADTPYYTSNAFFRKENFFGPDSVRYWQPASRNQVAEIVYRVNTPAPIEAATLRADLSGYQSFDSGALAFLDVSPNFADWTQIAEAGPGGPFPGPEYRNTDTIDITSLVAGGSEVYVRARLFTTSYSSSGSFGVPQWLRSTSLSFDPLSRPTFIFSATTVSEPTTVPEPSSLAIFGIGTLGIIGMGHRRKRMFSRRS